MRGTIDHRDDGFFPIEMFGDGVACEIISAGQAQEVRVHIREQFHQGDPIAIRAIVEGGREEGDQLERYGAGVGEGELEMIGGAGGHVSGFHRVGILLPDAVSQRDRSFSKHCAGGVRD